MFFVFIYSFCFVNENRIKKLIIFSFETFYFIFFVKTHQKSITLKKTTRQVKLIRFCVFKKKDRSKKESLKKFKHF